MYSNYTRKSRRKRKLLRRKKVSRGYKDQIPERVVIEEMSDWLPSWVYPRHLSDSEMRQPLRGKSI